MQERRKYIRVNEDLTIGYQVLKSFRRVTSHSEDISGGGIRLPVLQPLQPGMVLELEFRLPKENKIFKVVGEVAWQDRLEGMNFKYIVGIKFKDIDENIRNRIVNYVKDKAGDGPFGLIEE